MSSNHDCTPKAVKVAVLQQVERSAGIRGINHCCGNGFVEGVCGGRSLQEAWLRMAIPGSGSQLHPLHPDDAAVQFEHRPERPAGPGNSQTFKHFLHLSRTARVAQRDPVAGLPVAERDAALAAIPCPSQASLTSETRREGGGRRRERRFRRESCRCTRAAAAAPSPGAGDWPGRQAQFAMGSLGAQALGQLQFLAGTAGERQRRAAPRSRQNRARRPVARRRGAAAGAAGPGRARQAGSRRSKACERPSPAARPPPRTGRPGMRICGASRASSACHQASSSRASSAIWARCSRRRGFQPSSSGSSSWRMRLRVKVRWRLDESSRQAWPSSLR